MTIDFDDLMRSEQILLDQYPAAEEDLSMQLDQAGTKAAADSIREKRLKAITHNVQAELQKTLQSCILTESYPATTIAFNFQVIELDADLLQSLVNCASLALLKSGLRCRCLPVAVAMLLKSGDRQKNWIVQDPNVHQIKHQQQFSHHVVMTWAVDTKELIASSLVPMAKAVPLELADLDTVMALSLSVAE